jgi:tRNA threonylcarbamoyladenosine biosynthesis protein TsaB
MISLLLQNSAGQMAVGLGEGDQLIFDSSLDAGLVGLRNVQVHVQAGLDQSGKAMSDVDCVFVDVGPGGLGATRTTVAFANALGFAASIPVIGLHAFELIGRHVSAGGLRPVVCIRPAARPNYYIGKFEAGLLSHFTFADVDAVKDFVRAHRDIADFAGKFAFSNDENAPDEIWPIVTGKLCIYGLFFSPGIGKISNIHAQRARVSDL